MAVDLTPHFSLEELTTNGNHPEVDNALPTGWESRLLALAKKLEEARAILGVPLRVSYGYRSEVLNTACGGSKTSDHMQAAAVDINAVGVDREQVFRTLWAHESFMSGVDQMILERGCVHIGIGSRLRHQGRGDMPLYRLLAVWPEPLPRVLR